MVPEAGTDGSIALLFRCRRIVRCRSRPGDLAGRSWIAVNSLGSARIAGSFNFNMLFSHLRTPEQYRQYPAAYRAAGGHETDRRQPPGVRRPGR